MDFCHMITRGTRHADMRTIDYLSRRFQELPGPGKSDIIAIDSLFVCNSTAGA